MSPSIALHHPIFRAYVVIIGLSLTIGGVTLCCLRFGFKKNLGAIWSTYFSWLIIAPFGLMIVFAGRIPVLLGVILLAVFSFREFARVSGLIRDRALAGLVLAGIIVLGLTQILGDLRSRITLAVIVGALILLMPVLRNRVRGELQKVSVSLLAFIYLGWMFEQLGLLANSRNPYGYFIFIIFATEVCDIAAFTCGRLFGLHLLRSEISPNKTWEGAAGAFVVAMILPWLLWFSLPELSRSDLVLAGLIVGLGGQLGDLTISFFKREFGRKDMGDVIPGHGGILDRIDSLIFVAPLFVQLVNRHDALT